MLLFSRKAQLCQTSNPAVYSMAFSHPVLKLCYISQQMV